MAMAIRCVAAHQPVKAPARQWVSCRRPARVLSRPQRVIGLTCRAQSKTDDFHDLAKDVAGRLGLELGKKGAREEVLGRLQSWLGGSGSDSNKHGNSWRAEASHNSDDSPLDRAASLVSDFLGGHDDRSTSHKGSVVSDLLGGNDDKKASHKGSSGESFAGKLAHMAADSLGGNDDSHSRHRDSHRSSGLKPTALSRMAADYLGVDASTVANVGRWLVSADQREEKNDSKMVGALVHRLLNSFESNTGESFEGHEHQYDWIYDRAKAVLGSSITKGLLKRLVTSYLTIAVNK